MPSFTDTVFIITGAASGIGQELAWQAARKGAHVIATDRNGAGLLETVRLGAAAGMPIHSELLDIADPDAITRFAARVIPVMNNRKLVLINNAGTALSSGTFHDTGLADFEQLININLLGTIRMTKAFYPYFVSSNRGHIVNLSSVFGLVGVSLNVPYCTSKFGVRGFTESLRMELKETGIRTTCVHPGGVKTNIVRNAVLNRGVVTVSMHQKSIQQFDKQAFTTAASAAAQILKAVERNKSRLVIGMDGKALDLLSRILPVSYTRIIRKIAMKTFGAD